MGRKKAAYDTRPKRNWCITFWLQFEERPELLLGDDGKPYDFCLSSRGREAVRYLIWQREICPDVRQLSLSQMSQVF